MARLAYKRSEDVDPDAQALFAEIAGTRGRIGPLYQMVMNSPEIARGWFAMGNAVRLRAKLDGKLRELAILLVGHLLQADYEYSHHYPFALRNGASAEQLAALPDFETSPLFDERERDVLRFAKVSTLEVVVPDAVYEAARRHFDPQEMVELAATVGFYNMVCRVIHALQIELEPGVPSRLPKLRG